MLLGHQCLRLNVSTLKTYQRRETLPDMRPTIPLLTKWDYFQSVRNKLKAAIRAACKSFIEKALYSSKSSEVWKVIHRILSPSPKPLHFNPDELNGHFASTAQRTLTINAIPYIELTELIKNLPNDSDYHT